MAVDPEGAPITAIDDPLTPTSPNIDAMAYALFAALSRSTEDTSPDGPAERWKRVKESLPGIHATWLDKAKGVLLEYRRARK